MSSMQLSTSDFLSGYRQREKQPSIQLHPFIKANLHHHGYQSIYYAPCDWLNDYELSERFYGLLQPLEDVVKKRVDQNTVIWIILPPQESKRSHVINADSWCKQLNNWAIPHAHCIFSHVDHGVCEQLQRLLEDENITRLLIMSVDCLVTLETINEMVERQCIMTTQLTEGYAPGEAVAWVLLESAKGSGQKTRHIHVAHSERNLLPLIKAISHHEQHEFIHLYHHKPALIEEWNQVYQCLWLRQAENVALPSFVIERMAGECGAVMMVMGLAFMCQYAKNNPKILISLCEISDYLARGVVSL